MQETINRLNATIMNYKNEISDLNQLLRAKKA